MRSSVTGGEAGDREEVCQGQEADKRAREEGDGAERPDHRTPGPGMSSLLTFYSGMCVNILVYTGICSHYTSNQMPSCVYINQREAIRLYSTVVFRGWMWEANLSLVHSGAVCSYTF